MENTLDKKYTDLLQKILDEGVVKKDRTGTGTKSIFGYQIRHNMKEGFPLLTTKKMAWKSMVVELIWFLRGDTNIKYLVDNGCYIWVGDCYKNYRLNIQEYGKLPNENDVKSMGMILDSQGNSHPSSIPFSKTEFIEKIKTDEEFAKKWGKMGPIYGAQWRRWGGEKFPFGKGKNNEEQYFFDQIKNLINELKTNPDSRRLIVNAWNVGELDQMVLPPCHYGFQVYTRELSDKERWNLYCETCNNLKTNSIIGSTDNEQMNQYYEKYNIPTRAISLMWNQRSVDTFLGLPFNIASYGLLLEIIAKEVNMVPDELIGNLGDTHLYLNHLEQAKEQIGRDLEVKERRAIYLQTITNTWGTHLTFHFTEDDMDKYGIAKRTREPFPLPKVEITDSWKLSSKSTCFADTIEREMIKLVDYKSHSEIKAPLSN